MKLKRYSEQAFLKMRNAGQLAKHILDFIAPYVQEGITTDELNKLCHDEIIRNNAIPAPLNYMGYPKSVCISINDVVCHGIPDSRKLKNGDILNIDVTVILDGYYGDTSRMYKVGNISETANKLISATYQAMMDAISILRPGIHLGDIGEPIRKAVKKHGFSIVTDYGGHGIGKSFHEEPIVIHDSHKGSGPILEVGNCFTIEPMINEGVPNCKVLKDGWTAVTADGKLSAQFEHTIGITKNGFEIFTE